jgi:hypothetical protein
VHRATAAKLLNAMAQISQRGKQHVPNPSGFGKEKENEKKTLKQLPLFEPHFAATECRVS